MRASHTPGHSLAGSVVFRTVFHRFYEGVNLPLLYGVVLVIYLIAKVWRMVAGVKGNALQFSRLRRLPDSYIPSLAGVLLYSGREFASIGVSRAQGGR